MAISKSAALFPQAVERRNIAGLHMSKDVRASGKSVRQMLM
jgi:hypothetical protein